MANAAHGAALMSYVSLFSVDFQIRRFVLFILRMPPSGVTDASFRPGGSIANTSDRFADVEAPVPA